MVKVFLSSTGRDLKHFREATHTAICGLDGFHCVRYEDFGAVDKAPLSLCLKRVDECDVFVGIIGHCHGNVALGGDRSFTEHEYDAAAARPRLMFVAPDDFLLPASLRESDEAWKRQQRFRVRVMADRIVARFTSPENLAERVVQALANWRKTQFDTVARSGNLPHRYHIHRKIADGHSSVVLEGIDLVLERPVAIKRLKRELADTKPRYRDVFRREAKFLAGLDHANIVPLYEYCELPEGPLIVMKLAGKTLGDLAYTGFCELPLPIARIARQVAVALDHLSEQGISHRDVKPDNILMHAAGRLFLIDFGLAARFDDEAMWSGPTGAVPYLSPEILDDSGTLRDARKFCDQFSLGVTLYQVLTGSLPLDTVPNNEPRSQNRERCTAARMRGGELPVPATLRDPTIPDSVDRILLKMLSLSPDDRYPTNRSACEDLIGALGTWELQPHVQPFATAPNSVQYLNHPIEWPHVSRLDDVLRVCATPELDERIEVDSTNVVPDVIGLDSGSYVPHRYRLDVERERFDEGGWQSAT